MYITITAQKKMGGTCGSVGDYVDYLEKENMDVPEDGRELFFNHHGSDFGPEFVKKDIDMNKAKLKKHEPKFFSITLNPSQRELEAMAAKNVSIKEYTKSVMEEYARNFGREIEGRPIAVNDIKYYAKVERSRRFKGTDREVRENAPFSAKIAKLEHDLVKVRKGTLDKDPDMIRRSINELHERAPHKLDGKLVRQGMPKPGDQLHVHIIVSRKDQGNTISLSPNSKYKSSDVEFNGKAVKRGFDKDTFFTRAEETLDKMVGEKRNFVLSYQGRNLRKKDPAAFYKEVNRLPNEERKVALRILGMGPAPENATGRILARHMLNQSGRVILPNEIREAIAVVGSGKLPGTGISMARLKGYGKTASSLVELAKGGAVPEPTVQAAMKLVKFAAKALRALERTARIGY